MHMHCLRLRPAACVLELDPMDRSQAQMDGIASQIVIEFVQVVRALVGNPWRCDM